MELHLEAIGIILILLAIVHGVFPRRFNWQKEMSSLSLLNKQMMYVHTFFIALIVLLMGILCLSSAKELIETGLGKRICFGLGLFWMIRLVIQFFGYSSKLWKGKTFETTVHIVFIFLWTYLSFIFFKIAMV
jgi:hypothetical protein